MAPAEGPLATVRPPDPRRRGWRPGQAWHRGPPVRQRRRTGCAAAPGPAARTGSCTPSWTMAIAFAERSHSPESAAHVIVDAITRKPVEVALRCRCSTPGGPFRPSERAHHVPDQPVARGRGYFTA